MTPKPAPLPSCCERARETASRAGHRADRAERSLRLVLAAIELLFGPVVAALIAEKAAPDQTQPEENER